DPDQQTLPAGDVPGTLHRGGGVDVDHLVVGLAVQAAGHEVPPQALGLVGAGLAAVEDRGLFRLDGEDLDLGLALLEHLADTPDGATGADAGDHGVDAPLGVVPELLGGGAAMDIDVGGVVELLDLHRAGLLGDLLGLLDGALHALGDRKSTRLNSSHVSISYAVF